MSEEKDILSKRKEAILSWIKKPKNLMLIGVVLFAIIIRLYYFSLTLNQPLWWDEAEYMLKAKNIALGTPDTGFWPGRPILFPIYLSLFYFTGLSEFAIRFSIILFSVATVFLVYQVGKQLYNEKIGLISAFLFSFTYINLFYSVRILTDIPHVFLGLLGFAFFLSGKKRLIWLSIPTLALATLLRFPSIFFFVILAIYILITERGKAFKNRDYWISASLGFLVGLPYLVWSQIKFGSPLYAITEAAPGSLAGITFNYIISNVWQYLATFPTYLGYLAFFLFLFGIIVTIEVFLGLDILIKNKDKKAKSNFLLYLWLIIPLLYFGTAVSHYEDRYYFMAFPAIFYLTAIAITKLHSLIYKHHKTAAKITVILILAIASFQMLSHSDLIIKSKVDSYAPVKDAGQWIYEHTSEQDKILTKSVPHITYYSSRIAYSIPDEQSNFESNLTNTNPKYVIISLFEKHPDWVYDSEVLSRYNLTPVKAYPLNGNPLLIIYEYEK